MTEPLAVELFAGTMSGTAGWCELGGRAVGFDLEYLPHHGEPHERGCRVIQDVLTLHGSQFKDAAFIWASPPCQKYSYLAMPWSRSKCPLCKGKKFYYEWQLVPEIWPQSMDVATWGPQIACDCKENSRKAKELRADWEKNGPDNRLFDAAFRIQREASEVGGECIVCDGVGRRCYHESQLHELWGTCGSCNGTGRVFRHIPLIVENVRGAVPWVGRQAAQFGSFYLWGDVGQIGKRVIAGRDLADIRAGRGRFGMGVVPEKAVKVDGYSDPRRNGGSPAENAMGTAAKQGGMGRGDWFSKEARAEGASARFGSRSNARKAASALIAKIPPALSEYVGRMHYPGETW